jgi:hypothetical protein
MLELRIEQICSMPPYDHHEARIQLMDDFHALGIPRLDAEDIPTAVRPNVPLNQLTSGRLERLLALVELCLVRPVGVSPCGKAVSASDPFYG